MFRKIPFVEAERDVVGTRPGFMGRGEVPIYNTPVTPRENMHALFEEKHPYWMPDSRDLVGIMSAAYNSHLGRGFGANSVDCFDVHWIFEPTAGGSISEAGRPRFTDVNDWRKSITIPNVDEWDWAADAKGKPINAQMPADISLVNGFWFERLISFMDFMPAAMALIDEDQQDAIKDLFAATTELGCRVVDKLCEYWPRLDFIEVHDDWGAQKAPFFSLDIAYDLFVPYMKQLTDHIHSKGRHTMLHSCGHNVERVQCYIDGGFDMWQPQPMNDIEYLYDNYGDKIVLTVWPEEKDLATRSEAEQRAAARRYVDRFCQPGKPSIFGREAQLRTEGAEFFFDEVYRYSRQVYMNQE